MFYLLFLFSYFNPSPTTALYPLSLHDALPISRCSAATNFSAVSDRIICTPPERDADAACQWWGRPSQIPGGPTPDAPVGGDRKSTRLNSSHRCISYAVFCLKKKKTNNTHSAHT